MNRKLVARQVAEAREQLQDLEARLSGGGRLGEGEFAVLLGHAYHHLNFAWNCRSITLKDYHSLTEAQFRKWGLVPRQVAENVVTSRVRRGDV